MSKLNFKLKHFVMILCSLAIVVVSALSWLHFSTADLFFTRFDRQEQVFSQEILYQHLHDFELLENGVIRSISHNPWITIHSDPNVAGNNLEVRVSHLSIHEISAQVFFAYEAGNFTERNSVSFSLRNGLNLVPLPSSGLAALRLALTEEPYITMAIDKVALVSYAIIPGLTNMNTIEWIMLAGVILLMYMLFSNLLKSHSRAIIAAAFLIPAVFVALQGATQLMTADEFGYMRRITNMQQLDVRTLSQYRTTQLFLGSLFNILRGFGFTHDLVFVPPNHHIFYQTYKAASWLLSASFLNGILYVLWKWYIPAQLKLHKWIAPTILGLIGMLLFSLPLNSLMLKVANNDATSAFPSILGVLLAGVFIMHKKKSYAIAATVFALLGIFDKVPASPWFLVTLTLVILGVHLHNRHLVWHRRLTIAAAVLTGLLLACVLAAILHFADIISQLSPEFLAHEWITHGFNMYLAIFPIIYIVRLLYAGHAGLSEIDPLFPYVAVVILWATIFAAALLLYEAYRLGRGRHKFCEKLNAAFPKFLGSVITAMLVVSVIGSYTAAGSAGEGGFVSDGGLIGAHTPFFGAHTRAEHYFRKTLVHYATNILVLPTAMLILFCFLVVLLFRCKLPRRASRKFYFLAAILMGCSILPTVFSIGGQPGGGRYSAIIINFSVISAIALCCRLIDWDKVALRISKREPFRYRTCAVLLTCLLLLAVELRLYSPNVMTFSPLWRISSSERSESPLYVGHTGEAVMWGEDHMIAMRKIRRYYAQTGQEHRFFHLYVNYGWLTLGELGSTRYFPRDLTEESFTEDSWFSLSWFRLIREPTPAFLFEVEPYFRVQFRGRTALWIYRGDQLVDYMDLLNVCRTIQAGESIGVNSILFERIRRDGWHFVEDWGQPARWAERKSTLSLLLGETVEYLEIYVHSIHNQTLSLYVNEVFAGSIELEQGRGVYRFTLPKPELWHTEGERIHISFVGSGYYIAYLRELSVAFFNILLG